MDISIGILDYDSQSDYLSALLNDYADCTSHNIQIYTFRQINDLFDFSLNNLEFIFIDLDSSLNSNQKGIVSAKMLRARGFRNHIILISSSVKDAIKGYDVTATGFLIKPVSEPQLRETLNRIVTLRELHCFRFDYKNKEYCIPYKTILSFEKQKHDLVITTESDIYTFRESLSNIMQKLPKEFIQCHRSCVINILKTKQIINDSVILSNNTIQRIGRKYKGDLINRFNKITPKAEHIIEHDNL